MHSSRQSQGMTLVEMMVAICITGIVMTLSLTIFMNQYSSYQRGKGVKEVVQSGQEVVEILKYDLMQAGWSVKPQMSFYFQDGGANAGDWLVLNDINIIDLNRANDRALAMSTDCPGGVQILTGSTTSTITIPRVDIEDREGDGSSSGEDFRGAATQYVITDNTTNKIAIITSVAGTTLNLDRVLTGTYVAPGIFYCVDDGSAGACRVSGSSQTRVLRRSDRTTAGRQPMAENVVDLQVAYKDTNDALCSGSATQAACTANAGCEWMSGRCTGVWYGGTGCAGSGTGLGNFCTRTNFDPRVISLIRLSVVTRSPDPVEGRRWDSAYCRPAVENRTAAAVGSAECGYAYRTYTVFIQPRSTGPLYQ